MITLLILAFLYFAPIFLIGGGFMSLTVYWYIKEEGETLGDLMKFLGKVIGFCFKDIDFYILCFCPYANWFMAAGLLYDTCEHFFENFINNFLNQLKNTKIK